MHEYLDNLDFVSWIGIQIICTYFYILSQSNNLLNDYNFLKK